MRTEIEDDLSVLLGKVGGTNVEVLRDTACSGVIIKRELVGVLVIHSFVV